MKLKYNCSHAGFQHFGKRKRKKQSTKKRAQRLKPFNNIKLYFMQ